MTATKKTAEPVTAETATEIAPATVPTPLETFRARPTVALTVQAFKTTADGFRAVWQMESENQFGRSVAGFLKDIFVACLLPLISLVWLGMVSAWNWAWRPETHTKVFAKWAAFTAWLAPKFEYESSDTAES